MELKIATWNIRGIGTKDKKDVVKKLIMDQKLDVCAVLEARCQSKDVDRICNRIFGIWDWTSNMGKCRKGCRIMLGWNRNIVNVQVLNMSWQSIFCVVETIQQKTKFLCSFIYAANHGKERQELWKDLNIYRSIAAGYPWALLGDFNVTLTPSEHSVGGSTINADM
ncbi:RNA-directed DNA polymerase, eukaryota, reverse transcriptase zinc-binding domain protein [Tanacetum coccineum]